MKTYGIFLAGFIMRPFGAIFIGWIGDTLGRKPALIFSIFTMAIPTLAIGFLPTYQQVGLIAPLLLTIIRLFQGFAMGGEYGSSMVFLTEHAPLKQKAFYSSWTDVGCLIGVLLGNLFAWLLGMFLDEKAFMEWGWRLPFIVSVFLSIITLRLRQYFSETNIFLRDKTSFSLKKYINSAISLWPKVLPAICVYAFGNVCFYMSLIFLPQHQVLKGLMSSNHSYLFTSFISGLIAFFIPIGGYLSDKHGRKLVFFVSIIITTILSYFTFLTAHSYFLPINLILQILLALSLALFYGGEAAYFSELFPVSIRCLSVSLTLSLSNIVFGGSTPLIATVLTYKTQSISILSIPIIGLGGFAIWGLLKTLPAKNASIFLTITQSLKNLRI